MMSSTSITLKSRPKRVYAYCHGFLSDENSFKGLYLQRYFADQLDLRLFNLNGPRGYASISYSGALSVIDEFYKDQQEDGDVLMTLIGSSFGGYVAARYAELYPYHIEKLVLLCPGT